MEQRPLRLGDIVDDYCPRERRITNHAIVAIVEETVKQTRCTTCDHEHVFKQAREPRRRKKDEPAALYAQVLSGLQNGNSAPSHPADSDVDPEEEVMADDENQEPEVLEAAPAAAVEAVEAPAPDAEGADAEIE